MTRTHIQGGMVVTATDTYRSDILVEGGKIVALGQGFTTDSNVDVTIDAHGLFVFPGAIDEHTHMAMPFNGTVTASWETETIAAAVGGTTTIVDFAMQAKGESLSDSIALWKSKANHNTAIDYSLHVAITDLTDEVLQEIPVVVLEGVSTLKVFMAYKGEIMMDDEALLTILQKAKDVGALVMVHAENGDVIDLIQRQLVAEGKVEPIYHAISRPLEVEAEATRRAIALAKVAGAPIFIVHVSGYDSMHEIRRARANGQPVFAETCPQYLLLDESHLELPNFEGAKYVCSPPLRHKSNQEKLWQGLFDGSLQTIGTDHCSFNFNEQKRLGVGDFRKIPNGVNGIENWLQLIYTYGVRGGKISLNKMVELTSTNPAKYMGLYPQKGTIAVGSDADLVLYDPSVEHTIVANRQKQNSDYNLYEGFAVQGLPRYVLLRGQIISRDGEYVGQLGQGKFLPAKPFSAAYEVGSQFMEARASVEDAREAQPEWTESLNKTSV